jgi:succinate-acetate transporter protein
MTTVLLNIHNAGYTSMDTMILAMGVFIGGLAQVIAGAMEWKKNNTFGTTAFTLYGFFWLSLVALLVFPKMGLGEAPTAGAMGCYLTVWGIFTSAMFIGTLKLSRALQVVFASLAVLFFLLAAGDFTGSAELKVIAGYEGIFCGLSAMYAALAQVLNEIYKKTLLPL